jgi:hypothetical protein
MARLEGVDHGRRALLGAGGLLALSAMLPGQLRAQGAKMKIGVIGSGHIGSTIGGLWVKAGHQVMFSSRHPEELKDLVAGLGKNASAGTVEQAVAFGNVAFIAVPYKAIPQIGKDYASALKGKVLMDACNAVEARDGDIAKEVEANGIGMTTQKYFPGTHVVRAFNTMSYKIFASEAHRAGAKLAIPIAADDAEAIKVGTALVRDAGFDPVLVGKLADARKFQRGNPGYGQSVTAAELRQKLSLPK